VVGPVDRDVVGRPFALVVDPAGRAAAASEHHTDGGVLQRVAFGTVNGVAGHIGAERDDRPVAAVFGLWAGNREH
jgi:hypothetical protein